MRNKIAPNCGIKSQYGGIQHLQKDTETTAETEKHTRTVGGLGAPAKQKRLNTKYTTRYDTINDRLWQSRKPKVSYLGIQICKLLQIYSIKDDF